MARMGKALVFAIAVSLVGLIIAGCPKHDQKLSTPSEITKPENIQKENFANPVLLKLVQSKNYANVTIIYSRGNRTLPPRYLREKTVTLISDASTRVNGEYALSGYNGIIYKKKISVSVSQLKDLLSAAASVGEKTESLTACTGGVSSSLKISQNEKILLDSSAYDCAGKSTNASLNSFSARAEAILPDIPPLNENSKSK
jgi:hypothetical protein